MDEFFKNNDTENELRIKFEEANAEYKELISYVDSLKVEIATTNKKIVDFNNGILDSKKLDKIMYIVAGIILVIICGIGLLSGAVFSSLLVGIGTLSLSIPFICLIQSSSYRLHVKEIINNLNKELSNCEVSLKEEEKKLINKKNEMTNKFYKLVDDKVASNSKKEELDNEFHLKKYEKPYIRVKKINN